MHQTFTGPGIVICSFVPRLYDFDPDAVKVPYHHSNVDSDEVLFYSGGDFMSRAGSGIGKGSISLHPSGFVHGPQPGSRERSDDKDRTEELAVMMDTFKPLGLTDAARSVSDPDVPLVLGTPCLTRGRRSQTGPTSHSRTCRSASRASAARRHASSFASAITCSTSRRPASFPS